MSYIEQAIKEAVEKAGYKHFHILEEAALLDPLFWQALGKARGWSTCVRYHPIKGKRICGGHNMPESLANWHRFIDHLVEGKDADSFFAELLK